MLKVNSINVSYGDIQVLWDVSLSVNPGEIVCIVGSNGAGKTTIVKAITGMVKVTKGNISFMDEDITNQTTMQILEKGIVHVPEGRQLFNNMTVYENIYSGAFNKEAKDKGKETIQKIYDIFPRLKDRKDQLAGTLSGGEQQMLAVSRGLMSLPKCIIFDEPSLGLAPNLVDLILNISKEISQQGISVILVEQEIKKALKYSNRGYVVENGEITISGSNEELLNNDKVKKAYLGF